MSLYANLFIVLAIFAAGVGSGYRVELWRWNSEKSSALISQIEIERLQHRSHDVDLSRVIEAQNASNIRAAKASSDFSAANSELERLRGVISDNTGNGIPDTENTDKRTIAINTVFAECAEELTAMARKADGHVIDLQTFIDAGK